MKRVLLVGAGHAQLAVLTALARRRLPGAEVVLVSASERQVYSGMVPGLIAGRCSLDDCSIAIAPLAAAAAVRFLLAGCLLYRWLRWRGTPRRRP